MALGTPPLAWFCAATWPVLSPPLTLKLLFYFNMLWNVRIGVGGGSGGIRTHGTFRFAGFQDQCLKPLGHASCIAFQHRCDRPLDHASGSGFAITCLRRFWKHGYFRSFLHDFAQYGTSTFLGIGLSLLLRRKTRDKREHGQRGAI